MILEWAADGFAPAQLLQGFMDITFIEDLNSALVRFEQSYNGNYRVDTCSAVLVFYTENSSLVQP